MNSSAGPLHLAEQGALLLAEADPIRAARTLARGLRNQPTGGKLAVVRLLIQQLLEHDPGLSPAIAADLAALHKG